MRNAVETELKQTQRHRVGESVGTIPRSGLSRRALIAQDLREQIPLRLRDSATSLPMPKVPQSKALVQIQELV